MTYGFTIEAKFEALAAPTRRVVLERLKAGEVSVGALAAGLPVSRPAVSQHLKVLKEAGLVTERKEGVKRIYSIDRAGMDQLRDYFNRFWDAPLDAFQRSLEGGDG